MLPSFHGVGNWPRRRDEVNFGIGLSKNRRTFLEKARAHKVRTTRLFSIKPIKYILDGLRSNFENVKAVT